MLKRVSASYLFIVNMGKFLNEAAHLIPTFAGIKFTSTALDEGLEALNAHGGKYAVFLGADSVSKDY